VIYGNHHDAWVNGANDPIAGQISLDETARALGSLLRTGWRPARTIVLAAWDGEEWGLLGSTEWAEEHGEELRSKAVVYFNGDTNARGWLGASGSHSLEEFLREVARDVPDPSGQGSALDVSQQHRREQRQRGRRAGGPPEGAPPDTGFSIGALGSGSDYTVFIDHLAVPSLDVRYGGATHDGIYHSIYDSYTFYQRFLDSSFAAEVAQAQTVGTAILRMADAPVLPFEFHRAARTYGRYADEIGRLAERNDTTKGLDLAPLKDAIARLDSAAARYEAALAPLDRLTPQQVAARRAALGRVNQILYGTERALSDTAGLPRRPWFEHLMYAPGYYTGYGVKTMPGIREAVEQRQPAEAQAQAVRASAAILRMASAVDRAAEELAAALR
jgi:N-acetylated-alpha-linked acidic dipeptidase